MNILPINSCQSNNAFKANPTTLIKAEQTVQNLENTSVVNNKFRKNIFGCVAALGLSVLALLSACKKADDTKPVVTGNEDIVDVAFRNFVDFFNLDTVGQTRVLKHSYVLNEADSLVENFEYPTNPDTLYATGTYYYNGADPFMERETPFQSMWTRNGNEIVAEYRWPWEGAKHGNEMPKPQEAHYINGPEGDNSMKMVVIPESGGCMVDVSVKNDSAYYTLEDSIHFKRPFSVVIKDNY